MGSVIIKPAEKIPDWSYVFVTVCPSAVVPSPNSQLKVAPSPEFENSPDALKVISSPGHTVTWPSSLGAGETSLINPKISWQGSKQEIFADQPIVEAAALLKNSIVKQPESLVALINPGLWVAFPEYVVPVPELSGPSYIVKISAFSCVLKAVKSSSIFWPEFSGQIVIL